MEYHEQPLVWEDIVSFSATNCLITLSFSLNPQRKNSVCCTKLQEPRDVIFLNIPKAHITKIAGLIREKIHDDDGPAVQVVFMNHAVSRQVLYNSHHFLRISYLIKYFCFSKFRFEIEAFITKKILEEERNSEQLPILQKRVRP